jgi:predicted  nucleic acid-binding Zn-ribbon protein
MDPTIENLIRLQQLDGEIRQLRASLEATPRRIRGIESELAAHAKTISELEQRQRDEEARRRRDESDLKDQQAKITKSRQQLNTVQNQTQATALEHQIAFAEQEISRIEDGELESMERSDIIDRDLLAARQQHASHAAYLESEKAAAARSTGLRNTTASPPRAAPRWPVHAISAAPVARWGCAPSCGISCATANRRNAKAADASFMWTTVASRK